jgi:hypothetical protein
MIDARRFNTMSAAGVFRVGSIRALRQSLSGIGMPRRSALTSVIILLLRHVISLAVPTATHYTKDRLHDCEN